MTSRDFHLHPLDPGIEPAQLLALKHMDFSTWSRTREPRSAVEVVGRVAAVVVVGVRA